MDFWEALNGNKDYSHLLIKDSLVVIGGGGLITSKDNFLQRTTEYLVENNKVIFWGVGSNTFDEPSFDILKHENVLLGGIRDISLGLDTEYLPCVSCKNPIFDENYLVTDDVGIIEHPRLPINIDGFDKISNESTLDDIIKFIGSKSTIISSTYHGVYWSQLLNKKVIYYQSSEKLNSKIVNLKHRVPICNKSNYIDKITNLSHTNNLLTESRSLNDLFYKKVLEIFNHF